MNLHLSQRTSAIGAGPYFASRFESPQIAVIGNLLRGRSYSTPRRRGASARPSTGRAGTPGQPSDHPQAIFVANVDGTGVHRVTPWSLGAGDNEDWSPNGKWILFRSYEEVEGKQSQIYLSHPDGSGLRQLTHFKRGAIVTSSSFSPDGKWIVFATTGVGGNADLFVMRPDGSGMHPITRTKLWDSAPDWGPRAS